MKTCSDLSVCILDFETHFLHQSFQPKSLAKPALDALIGWSMWDSVEEESLTFVAFLYSWE